MQLTVQVSDDVVAAVHSRDKGAGRIQDIFPSVETLGYTLQPLHPGTTDPELRTYYFIDVPDHNTAHSITDRLSKSTNVRGVYAKPQDEAPNI